MWCKTAHDVIPAIQVLVEVVLHPFPEHVTLGKAIDKINPLSLFE